MSFILCQVCFFFFFISNICKLVLSQSIEKHLRIQNYKLNSASLLFQNDIKMTFDLDERITSLGQLPSDFYDLLNGNSKSFEIYITQGKLQNRRIVKDFKENQFYLKSTPGIAFFSPSLSAENINSRFFDIFSHTFKIVGNPFLAKSSYIEATDPSFSYLNYPYEVPCIEHLEAINELLPFRERKYYKQVINYKDFAESSYKSIRYFIAKTDSSLKIEINIIYDLEIKDLKTHLKSFAEQIKSQTHITFNWIQPKRLLTQKHIDKLKASGLQIVVNESSEDTEKILSDSVLNSVRYFVGDHFGLENFLYVNEIENTSSDQKDIEIYELFPEQFHLVLSSLKLHLEVYSSVQMDNLSEKHLYNFRNYEYFANFTITKKEESHSHKLFSYENVFSRLLTFKGIKLPPFSRLKLSFECRKTMMNFESLENEHEAGFVLTSGLLVYKLKDTSIVQTTKQVFYSLPNADETTPFHVLSISWVLYGFVFVQTVNIFLKSEGIVGGLLTRITTKLKSLFNMI